MSHPGNSFSNITESIVSETFNEESENDLIESILSQSIDETLTHSILSEEQDDLDESDSDINVLENKNVLDNFNQSDQSNKPIVELFSSNIKSAPNEYSSTDQNFSKNSIQRSHKNGNIPIQKDFHKLSTFSNSFENSGPSESFQSPPRQTQPVSYSSLSKTTPFLSKFIKSPLSTTSISPSTVKTPLQLQVEPKMLFVPQLRNEKNTQLIYIRASIQHISFQLSLSCSKLCHIRKCLVIPPTLPLRHLETQKPLDSVLEQLSIDFTQPIDLKPFHICAVFIEFSTLFNCTIREYLTISTVSFNSPNQLVPFYVPIVAYSGVSNVKLVGSEDNTTVSSSFYIRKSLPSCLEMVVPLTFSNQGSRDTFCWISASLFNKSNSLPFIVAGFEFEKHSFQDSIKDSFGFLLGAFQDPSLTTTTTATTTATTTNQTANNHKLSSNLTIYMTVLVDRVDGSTPPLSIPLIFLSVEEHLRQRLKAGNPTNPAFSILLKEYENEVALGQPIQHFGNSHPLKTQWIAFEAASLEFSFGNLLHRRGLNIVVPL